MRATQHSLARPAPPQSDTTAERLSISLRKTGKRLHAISMAPSDCVCTELKLCDEVTGLVHQDDRLVAVSAESGAELPCDAAWIATRWKPASDLASSLCDVDDAGFAKVDEHGRTSRKGVFAIGNASNPIAHLAHAAAAGTEGGPWVTMHLLESLLSHRRGA